MSNRPLDITQRQAEALLKAADKQGGIVEVKMGNTFARLIPASLVDKEKPLDDEKRPTL